MMEDINNANRNWADSFRERQDTDADVSILRDLRGGTSMLNNLKDTILRTYGSVFAISGAPKGLGAM
jgi:hypothetical protein